MVCEPVKLNQDVEMVCVFYFGYIISKSEKRETRFTALYNLYKISCAGEIPYIDLKLSTNC